MTLKFLSNIIISEIVNQEQLSGRKVIFNKKREEFCYLEKIEDEKILTSILTNEVFSDLPTVILSKNQITKLSINDFKSAFSGYLTRKYGELPEINEKQQDFSKNNEKQQKSTKNNGNKRQITVFKGNQENLPENIKNKMETSVPFEKSNVNLKHNQDSVFKTDQKGNIKKIKKNNKNYISGTLLYKESNFYHGDVKILLINIERVYGSILNREHKKSLEADLRQRYSKACYFASKNYIEDLNDVYDSFVRTDKRGKSSKKGNKKYQDSLALKRKLKLISIISVLVIVSIACFFIYFNYADLYKSKPKPKVYQENEIEMVITEFCTNNDTVITQYRKDFIIQNTTDKEFTEEELIYEIKYLSTVEPEIYYNNDF